MARTQSQGTPTSAPAGHGRTTFIKLESPQVALVRCRDGRVERIDRRLLAACLEREARALRCEVIVRGWTKAMNALRLALARRLPGRKPLSDRAS